MREEPNPLWKDAHIELEKKVARKDATKLLNLYKDCGEAYFDGEAKVDCGAGSTLCFLGRVTLG
jgi:hypothetical protein